MLTLLVAVPRKLMRFVHVDGASTPTYVRISILTKMGPKSLARSGQMTAPAANSTVRSICRVRFSPIVSVPIPLTLNSLVVASASSDWGALTGMISLIEEGHW